MVTGIPGIRTGHLIRPIARNDNGTVAPPGAAAVYLRPFYPGKGPVNKSQHNSVALAASLLIVSLAGCSTVKSGADALTSEYTAWEGHRASELLESWGQPDTTEELATDYVAYTWFGDAGQCRRTFMARAGKITGYSESDC